MGFKAVQAAYDLNAGHAANKAVLLALAWHSCETCGLTWVGRPTLATETELGRTRVTASLAALTEAGLLAVHAYPHGGRGMSTEYVVLPGLRELSAAPCATCRENMKRKGPPGGRYSENGSQGGRYSPAPSAKPAAEPGEKGPRGGHQQSVTAQQSGSASPRSAEPSLPVRQISDHPSDTPEGRQALEDARTRLAQIFGPEYRKAP